MAARRCRRRPVPGAAATAPHHYADVSPIPILLSGVCSFASSSTGGPFLLSGLALCGSSWPYLAGTPSIGTKAVCGTPCTGSAAILGCSCSSPCHPASARTTGRFKNAGGAQASPAEPTSTASSSLSTHTATASKAGQANRCSSSSCKGSQGYSQHGSGNLASYSPGDAAADSQAASRGGHV